MIGRMPFAMVLDVRDGELTPLYTHKGSMPADRPSIDDLIKSVQSKITSDAPTAPVDQ
jgi:peroxiredoxin Q/BCP